MTAPKKKARAPRPVEGGRAEQAEKVDLARQVLDIRIQGKSFGLLRYPNVPNNEIGAVRLQTGHPWTDITGEAGVAPDVFNYAVLAWLAKRAHGMPNLSWVQFNRDFWPDDLVRLSECEAPVVDLTQPLDPEVAEESDPES